MTDRLCVPVLLPGSEGPTLAAELEGSGFTPIAVHGPDDVAALGSDSHALAVAVVDHEADPALADLLLDQLGTSPRRIPLLVVASVEMLDALEASGRLGPDDELILRPYAPDAVRWRIEAMAIRSTVDQSAASGRSAAPSHLGAEWAARTPVYVIFNPKGGVGKTTIATTLAAALQVRKGRRVLLVDADTVTGHVALSLGMETGRTIADSWEDEQAGGPVEGLLDLAPTHESGVRVSALTNSPIKAANLSAERVAEAIAAARWGVDAIVVDLHPSYSEVNLAIFGIADRILVPVTPDLPAIRAAVQLLEVADQLGLRDRLALVVNRAESGVSVIDIEKTVGLPALAAIRSAGMAFVKAANTGRTVIDLFPKERITADFDHLADRLLGTADQEGAATPREHAEGRSILGFLGRKAPVRA